MLVVVDSRAPLFDGATPARHTQVQMLMRLVELFEQRINGSMGLTERDFASRRPDAQLLLLLSRLIETGLMPRTTNVQTLQGIVRVFARNIDTGYRPVEQYQGRLQLVVVPDGAGDSEATDARAERLLAGWRKFAPAAQLWTGSGNHPTVLQRPHVGRLATLMLTLMKDLQC